MLRGCVLLVAAVVIIAVCGVVFFLLYRFMNDRRSPVQVANTRPIPCNQVLPFVTDNLAASCRSFPDGSNTACYGNSLLKASFRNPSTDSRIFDERGELTSLDTLASLETEPYNPQTYEWGIGVLRLRALLEGTVAGEVVTMVLYGKTDLQPDDSHPVSGSDSLATLSNFPAFYFSTRAGTARDCSVLPEGGILVDTPDGIHVAFVANGVEITLGSTAILQASGSQMMVTVLDGQGDITVNGNTVTLGSMQQVLITMDSSGRNPLGFAGSPTAASSSSLGLPTICQISAALGLTFPCNVPQVVSISTATPTATATPVPTATSIPFTTPVPVVAACTATVNAGRTTVMVRDAPNGNQLGELKPGEIVTVAGQAQAAYSRICPSSVWYHIGYGGQPSAWVCGDYVTLSPACGSFAQGSTTSNQPIAQPSFAASYRTDPAIVGYNADGRALLIPYTTIDFSAADWTGVCAVDWYVSVDQQPLEPVTLYAPPFEFTYTFDYGSSVDITALPYSCNSYLSLDGEAEYFYFAAEPVSP